MESKQELLESGRKDLEEEKELLERGRREAAVEAGKLEQRREVSLIMWANLLMTGRWDNWMT